MSTVESLQTEVDDLKTKVDTLMKQLKKIQKIVKKVDQGETETPKRQNSLAKPIDISNDLKKFMGLGKDVQASRNDVTRCINAYIKENGLQQNEKNKREFILDEKLATIIKPDKDVTLSFFNYQKFMKECFPPKTQEPTTAAVTPQQPASPEKKVPAKTIKIVKRKVATAA